MPSLVNIIDSVTTPPLATLTQVLDKNGPYGPGSHTLDHFHTDGAFLLPAGDYQVNGTYGVIVAVNGAIPVAAGFDIGYNDPGAVILFSGDQYIDRIAQVCVMRNSTLSPAWVGYEQFDINQILQLCPYSPFLGVGMKLGLFVAPNWHVDLFYQCVL